MKPTCPVCGKSFWCDYPNQWAYKRGNQYICSWSCIREFDRKEASEKVYRKIKKDGTPAKPTGKKKPAEEPKVELVYDPEIAEEYRREQEQKKAGELVDEINRPKIFREIEIKPLQVCAVKSRAKEGAWFTIADNGGMYLSNSAPWLLTKEEWELFSVEIMVALAQLEIKK